MRFVKICKKTQSELKEYLIKALRFEGYDPIVGDGYIYARGKNVPVLLTAHMDTVHKEVCRDISNFNGIISSPQGIGGDDRCGIYMILRIIRKTELRPWILFCEDEEIGTVGAKKFVKNKSLVSELSELKYMIELDRAGKKDAVYYDCENYDFEDYITEKTGYITSFGSFSDISVLAPYAGIAAVNLSCGYYKAHTKDEYVVVKEMNNTIDVVIKLLYDAQSDKCNQYHYVEAKWSYGERSGFIEVTVTYLKNGEMYFGTGYGATENDAILDFLMEYTDVCWGDVYDYEIGGI